MQGEDYTWGGGSRKKSLTDGDWGSAPPSSSGWGDDNFATAQELERKAEQSAQAIKASQKRMLQMAQQSEQTGAATLAELQAQGETLKRMQQDQVRPTDR